MFQIFCDFDGTVTNQDSIVFLTQRFGGGPQFRMEILDSIRRKKISVFEAVRRELSSVKLSWAEAVRALKDNIVVDPHFASFVEWCRVRSIPLTVVSSGMEPVVQLFLEPFDLPYFAHPVEPDPRGWKYCINPEHSKERLLARASEAGPIVYIGDGTSDVAAIPHADILFVKEGRYLFDYCVAQNVPFISFSDFSQIVVRLESLVLKPGLECEPKNVSGESP